MKTPCWRAVSSRRLMPGAISRQTCCGSLQRVLMSSTSTAVVAGSSATGAVWGSPGPAVCAGGPATAGAAPSRSAASSPASTAHRPRMSALLSALVPVLALNAERALGLAQRRQVGDLVDRHVAHLRRGFLLHADPFAQAGLGRPAGVIRVHHLQERDDALPGDVAVDLERLAHDVGAGVRVLAHELNAADHRPHPRFER